MRFIQKRYLIISAFTAAIYVGTQNAAVFASQDLPLERQTDNLKLHGGIALSGAFGALVTLGEVAQGGKKVWSGLSFNPLKSSPLTLAKGIVQIIKSPFEGVLAAFRGPQVDRFQQNRSDSQAICRAQKVADYIKSTLQDVTQEEARKLMARHFVQMKLLDEQGNWVNDKFANIGGYLRATS